MGVFGSKSNGQTVFPALQNGQAVAPQFMQNGQALTNMTNGQAVAKMANGQALANMTNGQALANMTNGQAVVPQQMLSNRQVIQTSNGNMNLYQVKGQVGQLLQSLAAQGDNTIILVLPQSAQLSGAAFAPSSGEVMTGQ